MFRSRTKTLHTASGSHSGTVCEHIEVAGTFLARFVGLLGRKGLAEDAGLWLNPSRGVHTFGMRFPIDVVALDGEMRVIGLYPDLRAWKVAATSPKTRSVLEFPAGHIAASRIELGERLSVRARGECGTAQASRKLLQESGSALVEFSLLLPVLVFLFVGIADYGLEMQQGMQIMEAATAGASYGAINGNQKDLTGMQNAAKNSAVGVHGFTVTASNLFSCTPGGMAVTSATICTGYGTPIEYVKVTTGATVPVLLTFPGMPTNLVHQQTAIYRVAWKP